MQPRPSNPSLLSPNANALPHRRHSHLSLGWDYDYLMPGEARSRLRHEPLRGRQVHPSAEAGCLDRNLRPRLCQVEPLLDQGRLRLLATTDQAFVQPVQRPEVIGMLAGAAQLAVEAEVGAVYRLGFLDPALLEEKGPQRMAGRLHPSPWLVIGQSV